MRWLWLTSLLAGCPYVFGGPDLSNVVGGPGVGTDTDLTADTADSGSVSEDAPDLVVVSFDPTPEGAVLTIVVTDPNGDMDGGSIEVIDGAETVTYAVPDGLLTWSPDGASLLEVTPPSPCDGFVLDLAVTAIDAAGHRSVPAAAVVSVEGFGVLSTQPQAPNVGTLTPPTLLCGEIGASFEPDQVAFGWDGGTVQGDLTWSAVGADLDLFLLDDEGLTVADSLTFFDAPEHIQTDLNAGEYVWAINHYAGPLPAPWTLLVTGP